MTLMIPTSLIVSFWGRLSLRWAAGDEADAGLIGTVLAAFTGYLGVVIALQIGASTSSWEAQLALCVFGSLLLVAAWTDHRTAWSPDGITLPLMGFGAASASLIGPLMVGPGWAIGVALIVFALSQAAWGLQVLSGFRILPPPDLMALSLPFLLFGLTPFTFLSYLVISALLLLLLRAPEPLYRCLRGPAATEAVEDAGLVGAGRSAPFLPIALGALYGVLILRLLQG